MPRAADDFEAIRARMEELRRARNAEASNNSGNTYWMPITADTPEWRKRSVARRQQKAAATKSLS